MNTSQAQTLGELLQIEIASKGPIPFREFMAHALYHPDWGYYSSGHAAIGRAGDFYTSVSVGPLFGALIARQVSEMWRLMGQPTEFNFVEQGAHRGDFAHDLLRALQSQDPSCLSALRYTIVEPCTRQSGHQQQTLAEFSHVPMRWLERMEDLQVFVGIHFSNELLDAFPVHRLVWNEQQWEEQYVTCEDGHFHFVNGPISTPALADAMERLPSAPPNGYICEMNLAAQQWATAIAGKLQAGYVLAIDYGWARAEYYRPERMEGTLSGYAHHQRVKDPLADPGTVDLTAHVEFTSIAEAGEAAGLRLSGFTDQHHFMVGLSRLHFSDIEINSPERDREIRAFKTLMHPTLLGQNFKVLCLEKAIHSPLTLAGLSFSRNSRETLGLATSSAEESPAIPG